MRSSEDIMKDVMRYEVSPDGYNLIEAECFLVLKRLFLMFRNGEISKVGAGKMKEKIFSSYEGEVKQYDFMISLWQENLDNIKKTENDRIKLHKLLNKTEPVNEERLTECLKAALNIVACVFPGEFQMED